MEEWMQRFARDLGEQSMSPREMGKVLHLAREVAHGVERKVAPLAAFLAGIHVGRRAGEGGSREEALAEALRTAGALLHREPSEDTPGSAPSTGE
jgi:hypothetical protein